MAKQKTIKRSFSLEGKGLHTGLSTLLTFHPAPVNHGIKIKRIDVENSPLIDALAENVVDTMRGTVLEKGNVQISTIEHTMAALYALEIDNCLLEVNAPEFPILDGSAKFFTQGILDAGIKEQQEEKDYFIVQKKIEYQLPNCGSQITILPDDKFSIDVHIGFKSSILNNQYASLASLDGFAKEIAHSRTFVFVREIEPLMKMGLIKGGDLENAVVIYDESMHQKDYDQLADILGQPHHDANELGYLTKLSSENEPARHKLLDVIGDLALIGKPLKGKVIARFPGHKVNTETAILIRKEIKKQEIQAPVYDDSISPLLDTNAIRKLLPHRWPFLLVDKVIDIKDKTITAVKNVSGNESFFVGHFPEEPVMPGVLIIEAAAQAGGLLVLSQLDDAHLYSTYFLKIDNVKFRQKVVPGDTIIFRIELLTPIRRGIATMRGLAFVGGKIVCEAEFTAQIIKNKK